ncbi:MAG: ferredoxin--NADP reductase [Polyangiaceae bacterium]
MVNAALSQLGRDVRTVVSSFLGNKPSPLVERRSRRAPPVVSSPALGRPMRIAEKIHETADMVSLVLEPMSGEPIAFAPGQFFTLVVPVAGTLHKRAYSASSRPGELGGKVRVTVKRVPAGLVSERLVSDETRVGDVLSVLGPSGSFGPTTSTGPRALVLLAGGSGITPMMAIARTLLPTEPETTLTLVFGNRSKADIPFLGELEALVREHPGRFVVRHVLAEAAPGFDHAVGTLTRDVVTREVAPLLTATTEVLVCGPEGMMSEARAALEGLGVPRERLHVEAFVSPREGMQAPTAPVAVTVTRNGAKKHAVQMVGQTLLEAGLAATIDMPFSCAMGGCGACKVRIVAGETTHEGSALTPLERERGYVLACVDRALGPCELEVDP